MFIVYLTGKMFVFFMVSIYGKSENLCLSTFWHHLRKAFGDHHRTVTQMYGIIRVFDDLI